MSLAQWIAAAGGLGLSPIAPGTVGSVGGVVLFVGMLWMGLDNPPVLVGLHLALIGVLFGLGVWASSRAEYEWACHDDNRIVIDEVVGQLIALSPLVWLFGFATAEFPNTFPFSSLFLWVVTGFVLFRLFDVWKPGAVRWAERRFERGWGVMADDVVAGLYSAVVLFLVFGLLDLFGDLFGDFSGDISGDPFLDLVGRIAPSWTEWGGALSGVGMRSLGLGTEALA